MRVHSRFLRNNRIRHDGPHRICVRCDALAPEREDCPICYKHDRIVGCNGPARLGWHGCAACNDEGPKQ